MARLPRLIVPGLPHLVSQRAQHGQVMVHDDADRGAFLTLLGSLGSQHGIVIHAYAIRETGFDLLLTPPSAESLSQFMQAVSRRHAAAFNRRHDRRGGLWEGRFRVAPLDPQTWLLDCMLYVESRSDVGRGDWTSRSRPDRDTGLQALTLIDPPAYWALGNTPFEREAAYQALRARGLGSAAEQSIEGALRGGWVLGSAGFVASEGLGSGRPAMPRPRGRPRTVRN